MPFRVMIYPFLVFPFMFILKSPDPSNLVLIAFPELVTFFSICFVLFNKKISVIDKRNKQFFVVLFTHLILTTVVCSYHVFDISFLIIILRQYTLPLFFLIAFLIFVRKNEPFIEFAMVISIIAYSFVGLFAILNILGVINFNSTLPELQPVLTIINDNESIVMERDSVFMLSIPRLNLLTGGALGSSAAIFASLAIILQFGIEKSISKSLKFFCSLILLISSLMTSSFSIVIPFLVLFGLFYLYKYRFVKKAILFVFGFIVAIISIVIFSFNPFSYFNETVLKSLIGFFSQLSFKDFILGIGPRITTAGFNYINENKFFVIDVGILRVFVETGVLNFLIYLFILVYIFRLGIYCIRVDFDFKKAKYLFLFMTFCLLIHANFSILPPFYPLFTLSIAGVFVNYYQSKISK